MQFDFIDDNTLDHASLDAEVNAILNAPNPMCDSAIPPHPIIILQVVVQTVSPKGMFISMDLRSSTSIIVDHSRDPDGDENSNLTKILNSCWRGGKFRKIRCLSEHSFTNSLILAMSYSTTEILRPTPAQTSWEDSERYT